MRCKITLPPGMAVCRRCNPAGLPVPSVTQSHATVFLSVLLAIGLIAVLLAMKG